MSSIEHIDSVDPQGLTANGCASDTNISGGPPACSGPLFTFHAIYPDAPDRCWDFPVCLTHAPYAIGFAAQEQGDTWWTTQVSLTPLLPAPTPNPTPDPEAEAEAVEARSW